MVLRSATIAVIGVGAWRSLVAYLNGVQRAGGSNPLAPTNSKINRRKGGFLIFFVSSLYPLVDMEVSDEYKGGGNARVAELGDALDLGSSPLARVGVQIPSLAPYLERY